MNINNLTIRELVSMGASVDIYFHGLSNRGEAYKAVKDLSGQEPEIDQNNGAKWAKYATDDVTITAFYEVEHE